MPLEPQTVSVRFGGGIETKEDPKSVHHSKLLTLENGVFTEGVTIGKRFGYDSLTKSILGSSLRLPTGRALTGRGGELLLLSDSEMYSWDSGPSAWTKCGNVQSVGLSHEAAVKTTAEQIAADYDELGGIGVYAWEDSRGGVYFSVVDSNTGRTLIRPTSVDSNGSRPRVHAVGDVLHVYYADDTNGRIWALVVPPQSPLDVTTPSPAILTDDLDKTVPSYDVDTDASKAVIAWYTDAGDVRLGYVHQSGELGRPANGLTSVVTITATVTKGIAVALDPGGASAVALAWRRTSKIDWRTYDSSLVQTQTGFESAGSTDAVTVCFQSNDDANGERRAHIFGDARGEIVWFWVTTAGSVSASVTTLVPGDGELASKAFRDTGDGDYVYINLNHDTTLYSTYLTMRHDGLVVARYLSGIAGAPPATDHLPSVKTSSRTAVWAGIYKQDLESANDDVFAEQGIRKVTFDFGDATMHRTAQLGNTLYIAGGGMLQAYDGDSAIELFHWAIDDVGAPTEAAGGNLAATSTYTYRFSLEYILANGEVLRGPVSAGTAFLLTGANNKLTFAVPMYRITRMTSPRGEVRIGVWRTLANGSLFYRVSSLDPTATGNNGYLANDPSSATATFADIMSDTDAATKEPLYTTGGILYNDPTPCGGKVVAGKNRLFFNDPSDPLLVHYSQELADGYAVEIAPTLSVKLDPEGGDITGLAVMDDVVFAFKERAIFAFAGPGLGATGNVDGFSQPQLVPSSVGCKDARSLVVTPPGILFQGEKGFWLVDRGRRVTYVGAPVEAYAEQTIVSAEVIEDRHEVRLLTSSGLTLCWDYFFDQWSTFTNHEGIDAVTIDSVYHYLRNDGYVWQETENEYADDNRQIMWAAETAWIKLREDLQGFQIVWNLELLGEYLSAHTMKVWIQFDYEPGWYAAPWELDPSGFYDAQDYGDGVYGDGPYGGESGTHAYQFKLHVAEECEAFRLRIEFVETAGVFGACATLSELLVEGGVTGTRKTLQDERSY